MVSIFRNLTNNGCYFHQHHVTDLVSIFNVYKLIMCKISDSAIIYIISQNSFGIYLKPTLVYISNQIWYISQTSSGIYLKPTLVYISNQLWYISQTSSGIYLKLALVYISS